MPTAFMDLRSSSTACVIKRLAFIVKMAHLKQVGDYISVSLSAPESAQGIATEDDGCVGINCAIASFWEGTFDCLQESDCNDAHWSQT